MFQPKNLIAAQKRNWVNIGLLLANFCYLQLNRLQVLKFKKPIMMNRSNKGKFLLCFFFFCFVIISSAWHSVCTTVTHLTFKWPNKVVNKVGSTVLYRNVFGFSAFITTSFTKADLFGSFTIFHCRMGIIQPARVDCTTSVVWHPCCWHFCSSSSHKTIPSLRELFVTQLWTVKCFVTFLSIGFTQVFIMIARIRYKVIL